MHCLLLKYSCSQIYKKKCWYYLLSRAHSTLLLQDNLLSLLSLYIFFLCFIVNLNLQFAASLCAGVCVQAISCLTTTVRTRLRFMVGIKKRAESAKLAVDELDCKEINKLSSTRLAHSMWSHAQLAIQIACTKCLQDNNNNDQHVVVLKLVVFLSLII